MRQLELEVQALNFHKPEPVSLHCWRLKKIELRVTLKHVTNSQELAKIDPDTSLQEDVGPSLNRVIAVSPQRTFSRGSIFISYAQADARDLRTGEPTPEAPRLIWDAVATENHLPFGLRARAEFEFVRAKPLGAGCGPAANLVCIGTSLPEFRGAVLKPFLDGRMILLPPDQTLTTSLDEHEESHDRAFRYSIQSRAAARLQEKSGLPQRCPPPHERHHRNRRVVDHRRTGLRW